jgi:preprotein translocase subunit SecA
MEEGVPIEHGMVTKAIERAQRQVEAQNFATRKHLLEYDDVMNKQRENVYTLRRELLEGRVKIDEEEELDTRSYVMALADDIVAGLVEQHAPDTDSESRDISALERAVVELFGVEPATVAALKLDELSSAEATDAILAMATSAYEEKERILPDPAILRRVERDFMLQIVDAQWKDHLYSLDHLKDGIGLRGYGQRDPLVEYKKESFTLFQAMKDRIDEEIVRYLWRLRPVITEAPNGASDGAPTPPPQPVVPKAPPPRRQTPMTLGSGTPPPSPLARAPHAGTPQPARTGGDDAPVTQVRRDEPKIGRNDPCWCGSGKKYKKCHGQ